MNGWSDGGLWLLLALLAVCAGLLALGFVDAERRRSDGHRADPP